MEASIKKERPAGRSFAFPSPGRVPGREGTESFLYRGETGRRGRRPLRWSIGRKADPEKADTYPLPPDERQRKEELVHSSRDKPPLNLIARGKSFRLRRSFSRAPVSFPVPSFSLLDRARPVFSFSSGRKRENGGCKEPAIFMAESSPARKGKHHSLSIKIAAISNALILRSAKVI